MGVLIIGINSHGKIEIWNQLAASTTGFPAEMAYGRDLFSSLISTNKFNFTYKLKYLRQILDNAIHGKMPLDESNFLLSSGKMIAMSLKLISWHKNLGGLHGIILIGYDVSGLEGEKGYTYPQEFLDFINCSDLPLTGLDCSNPSSPVDTNGRKRTYFSFPSNKPPRTDCARGLVAGKDPSKDTASRGHGKDFLHSLDALVFGVDSFGKVDLWNDKSEHVFGCSREAAIGKNFVQVVNLQAP